MKNVIKFILALACGALLLYAAYLVYVKFFTDADEADDLYEEGTVSFSDRVKKAAEKQLEKIS